MLKLMLIRTSVLSLGGHGTDQPGGEHHQTPRLIRDVMGGCIVGIVFFHPRYDLLRLKAGVVKGDDIASRRV